MVASGGSYSGCPQRGGLLTGRFCTSRGASKERLVQLHKRATRRGCEIQDHRWFAGSQTCLDKTCFEKTCTNRQVRLHSLSIKARTDLARGAYSSVHVLVSACLVPSYRCPLKTPFARAFALQSSGGNCFPAHDLAL